MVALRALEHFLAAEGPPDSFLLRAWAHDMADHTAGPRVLGRGHRLDAEEAVVLRELRVSARGRRLGAEEAEALRELHRTQLEVGRQQEGWCRRGSSGTDELGDAVQPALVEVVDHAVTQELACHEQRGLRVCGWAASMRRRAGQSQRRGGGAAVPPHGGVQ